ncbi:MAG: tetratricopeptide repeat protein [Planctomycetes bacterium]|nr:tetratricopeptide repeat protein [Planctomycetota bacterium]
MRREDTVRLDTHALLRALTARGLKQEWVARQVGVDRKTVSRWCTGKVKRLARAHAARLAEVVGCPARDLTVRDEADVLATKEEQRVAARLIQERDLLARLAPTDDWRLAEGLLRATLQPDLPLGTLGRLYNLLATAAWRQGKYDEAARHVARARDLGQRAGDRRVLCGATYNQAVVDSLRGDHAAALAAYERCLARPDDFDTPRDRAKVLSNLAVAYESVGRGEDAVATQAEAIREFEGLGLDLNLAIAWVSQGCALTALGRHDEALAAHARAEAHARRAGYARGVDCAPLYRADPLSLLGRREAARALVVAALPGLARHEVYDLGCHEAAARVLRRAGDLEGAARQVDEGLRRGREAGVHEACARLHVEAARLALARGDRRSAAGAVRQANAALRRAGLPGRALAGPPGEHGDAVSRPGPPGPRRRPASGTASAPARRRSAPRGPGAS